ncbi:hypothetical protein HZH68_007684 [Vespula germanica]|uniref:PiggyBac transposable element-derived protein domain-containing protein n=1 Tax=Vespula germanica TaxID=30212 RepID=A0A834N7H2_VESGE|nr:hypothetical protein HZH68_007684 [Vespula germanica]
MANEEENWIILIIHPMFLLNFGIHIQIGNKARTSSNGSKTRTNPTSHHKMYSTEPNVFSKEVQNVEDFADLFIESELIEFISMETNTHRILIRVALAILMGWIKKPRMNDYSSTNSLLETSMFREIMTHNRITEILSVLHFSDNSSMPNNTD